MTSELKTGRSLEKWFWILCVVGVFAILSSTMSKNPVLNPFAKSLGTPTPLMGFVAAASTVPGILVSLPAGTLSDIFGRRKVLLVSSVVFASAPFLYLFITSWWHLVLVRFYHGFATAIFIPVANASIAELFPTKKGERISTFSATTVIGRSIAPFLGGYILFITNYDFHVLYLAVGVAGATALIIASLFLRDGSTSKTVESKNRRSAVSIVKKWEDVAKNYRVVVVSVIEAAQYYTYGAVEYFLVGYLSEVLGLDSLLIGVISGGLLIVIPITKPFMGRFSDKVGRRIPIIIGCIVAGLPLLGIPFSNQFLVLLLLAIVYGIGFSLVTSSTPPLVSELVSNELTGTAMGFMSTMMDVGQTIGPVITGLILATNLGYSSSFGSLTAILFCSFLLFLLSQIKSQSQQKE